jgi:hypothetical protein
MFGENNQPEMKKMPVGGNQQTSKAIKPTTI